MSVSCVHQKVCSLTWCTTAFKRLQHSAPPFLRIEQLLHSFTWLCCYDTANKNGVAESASTAGNCFAASYAAELLLHSFAWLCCYDTVNKMAPHSLLQLLKWLACCFVRLWDLTIALSSLSHHPFLAKTAHEILLEVSWVNLQLCLSALWRSTVYPVLLCLALKHWELSKGNLRSPWRKEAGTSHRQKFLNS